MSRAVVATTGISKRYGEIVALDAVTLSVPVGSVYGLVGPNGAGKTTLLAILSRLRTPTAGTFEVNAARVSVLPDTPRFDPWLTASEVVDLSRVLNAPGTPPSAVKTVLGQTGLHDVAGRRVGGFSRGMLQRLGLAAAVVGNPELLLLDEPAAALDPAGRREVLDMVTALRGGSTVVFSSHILDDVQQVCDNVGILNRGALVYEGTLDELVRGAGHAPTYRIEVRGSGDAVGDYLRSCDWTLDATVKGEFVTVSARSAAVIERELIRCLSYVDIPIVSVKPLERTLEDVFLEVTK
ncbi:MAG TPA: ABC transporter ATP-binding protein [Acidimicrobiia bacterium]|nr:ABC transporter ATP-binding protein [Acidimicrobiia bacterium]